ncbi:MAG: hypothetical protein AB3K77_10750 [Methanosarcinaceae archaeon]
MRARSPVDLSGPLLLDGVPTLTYKPEKRQFCSLIWLIMDGKAVTRSGMVMESYLSSDSPHLP